MELSAEAQRLLMQLGTQRDIIQTLLTMSGDYISAVTRLASGRENTLMNRVETYRYAARAAHSASAEIEQTKTDLAQIVNKADSDINAAKQKWADAVSHSAGNPAAIAAADVQLGEDINQIVTNAEADAALRDAGGVIPAAQLVPTGPIQQLGADGAPTDVLMDRAADSSRFVVSALVAQTRATGYMGVDWAVSLLQERDGSVSAWLASSEGPSYIPLGVGVPLDVKLAIGDPVARDHLAGMSERGANPLEVLVQHAEMRQSAAPGTRMLALAGTAPSPIVNDWAMSKAARAVAVDASSIAPSSLDSVGALAHRCAAAMPWDWRQATHFSPDDRLQAAERLMRQAGMTHFGGDASTEAMRLFELQRPIPDEVWSGVQGEWNRAVIDYQLSRSMDGLGSSDPLGAFAKARAAELVLCLRNAHTAEGCADVLYTARLAGSPLS